LLLEQEDGDKERSPYVRQLDREALTGLCDASEKVEGGAGTPFLPWQHALRNTWRVLQAYHLTVDSQQPDKHLEKKEESSWASRLEAGDQAARTIIKPSVGDALEEIKAMVTEDGEEEALDVLVTGSLYLVGNVLGWLEKEGTT
jgi:hypothetical protein